MLWCVASPALNKTHLLQLPAPEILLWAEEKLGVGVGVGVRMGIGMGMVLARGHKVGAAEAGTGGEGEGGGQLKGVERMYVGRRRRWCCSGVCGHWQVCCSAVYCVAVRCDAVQCVAVSCSVFQCVAV